MASVTAKTGNVWGARYAAVLIADANGLLSVTFPAGRFTSPPVVTATGVTTDGRDVAVSLTADPTATGCSLQARKSQKLPATGTLTSLLGFDPFVGAAGAKIHVIAQAVSA